MLDAIMILALSSAPGWAAFQSGYGDLFFTWMGVIDNGEGDGCPHGPHGNFHVEVFEVNGSKPLYKNFVLRGPSKNEWLDGDAMSFNPPVYLFTWRHPNDQIRLKIWESDPGPFRSHDTVFEVVISRMQTLSTCKYWSGIAPDDAIKNVVKRNPAWVREFRREFGQSAPAWPKTVVQLSTRQRPAPPGPPPPQPAPPSRRPCVHRIPCQHPVPCQHRIPCRHPVQTPYGVCAMHPFDLAHPFDLVHPWDTLHPYD